MDLVQHQFSLINKSHPQYKPAFLYYPPGKGKGKEVLGNIYYKNKLAFVNVPITIDSEYRLGLLYFNDDNEYNKERPDDFIELCFAVQFLRGDINIQHNILYQDYIQIEFETIDIAINIYKLLIAYEITAFPEDFQMFKDLFKKQTNKEYSDVPLHIQLNSTYYIDYLPDKNYL